LASLLDEALNSQHPAARLHSEALGYMLSAGRKFKTGIRVNAKLEHGPQWLLRVHGPQGYYTPEICPKFQTGNRVFVFTAGNWTNPEVYRLTVVPLELSA
jgi:hypothetical protein